MLSLEITDIRQFTQILFSSNAFDRFLLHDLDLKTAVSFSLDGEIHTTFFEEETDAVPEDSYILWEKIRPTVFSLIRGKHPPLNFRIVLLTSRKTTQAMMKRAFFTDCDVSSLSLNIVFREKALFLTTGVSYLGFTLEKSLEKAWDATVRDFLESRKCIYQDL